MMVEEGTVKGYFNQNLKVYEDNLAISYPEGNVTYTYREMLEKIDDLAKGFALIGVSEKSRVALYGEENTEWILSYLAIARVGATPVCLNQNSTLQEMQYILNHKECDVLVASRKRLDETFDLDLFGTVQKAVFQEPTFSLDSRVSDMDQLEETGRSADSKILYQHNKKKVFQSALKNMYLCGTLNDSQGEKVLYERIHQDILAFQAEYEDKAKERAFAVLPIEEVAHNLFTIMLVFITGGSVVLTKRLPRTDVEKSVHEMGHPTVYRVAPMSRYVVKCSMESIRPQKHENGRIFMMKSMQVEKRMILFQSIDSDIFQ